MYGFSVGLPLIRLTGKAFGILPPTELPPTPDKTMRLTLRTLLAYMDDILDPADQESLGKQVSESENATELLHRTRDAMRRLRLGAPPVVGEGMELDPNVAAEYLDSTLSADDMSDYQQVCLDSDVHLAEVASCHHILTMVLGEPAEIEPAMRERMYGIPGRVDEWRKLRLDAPHPMAGAATAAVEEPAPTPEPELAEKVTPKSATSEPHHSQVPDYLRASESSRWGRMAFAFAAALLLGFGGFAIYSAMNKDGKTSEVAVNDPSSDSQPKDNAPLPLPMTTDEGDLPELTPPPLETESPNESAMPEATTTDPAGDDEPFELPTITGLETPLADTTDATPADVMPEAETPTSPDAVVENVEVPTIEVPTLDVPPVVETPAIDPEDPVVAEGEPGDDPRVALNVPTGDDPVVEGVGEMVETTDVPAPIEDAAPSEPQPVGTMMTQNEVLLRWDPVGGAWMRLPSRSSIIEGDQLMSLPTYRPSLALASGALRVEMCDGAMAAIGFGDNRKVPRLSVTYGRFLLINAGMEPLEVELAIGDETRLVTLESTAIIGLDVDRPWMPGADVENSLGAFRAMFYAPAGKLTWDTLPVASASQWEWHDTAPASLSDNVDWMDGQSLDYLEKNVSISFEQEIDTERSLRIQLLELYESSRRREDKALASLCATHVGQFIPFVQALADTQQQSNWDDHIHQLRRSMSRSTQAAKLVHQTLTEQRGADVADDLFEMLRGYSPEQIGTTPDQVKAGITRQLIDWLEHDRLEYRVLAILNLKQIYGGKTLGYNPVVTEPSRQQRAVKMWRTRLADNELVPGAR